MERPDRDDRAFRIDFAGDGTSRLREVVREKLKEFMGDYTDDTLVEYVLVLLRNGRSKDESQKELNVFLGDDSASFVSWLWDHLSSSMHLYTQQTKTPPDEGAKTSVSVEHSARHDPQIELVPGDDRVDSENERDQSKISINRRNKEWRELAEEKRNPFPLKSTMTKILHPEEKSHTRSSVRRSPPRSQVQVHRKRSREEDREPTKKKAPHQELSASRRLLQFAVRDAVRTMQQPSSRSEPATKRLRSVVAAANLDPLPSEKPQKIRSVARGPGLVSAALKAAAEAAADVTKTRSSGSVFDRLSRDVHTSQAVKQPPSPEPMMEDGECEDGQIPDQDHQNYGSLNGDMTMLDRNGGSAVDSASDNEGYGDVDTTARRRLNACQTASSANIDNNSLTVNYSVAQNAEFARGTRLVDEADATTNPSSKIVNISVNVNTWKPPHYQVPRNITEADARVATVKSEVNIAKTDDRIPKENNASVSGNGSEMAGGVVPKEVQKTIASTPGSYTTVRPSEDVDSRTVFISNVHFAATKDALSRHFNKFGEVLKVIIVTDAATGQPKGSAYVEFLRKESAESALSLNGTSFMSRMLKVIRKSSMHQEGTPMLGWPRAVRPSPFAVRLRLPFPRGGLPGAYRARLPLKPGARSLQWKREPSTTPISQNLSVASATTPRNHTYVRPESNVEGS